MRFSKHTRQCLEDIEKATEYESDLLLVHLVKIQRLTERIHNWTSQEDDEDDVSVYLKAPAAAYQVAFHGEIDRLQSSMPASLVDNSELALFLEKLEEKLTHSSLRTATGIFCLCDASPQRTASYRCRPSEEAGRIPQLRSSQWLVVT